MVRIIADLQFLLLLFSEVAAGASTAHANTTTTTNTTTSIIHTTTTGTAYYEPPTTWFCLPVGDTMLIFQAGRRVLVVCVQGAHRSALALAIILVFLSGASVQSVCRFIKRLRTPAAIMQPQPLLTTGLAVTSVAKFHRSSLCIRFGVCCSSAAVDSSCHRGSF